MELAPVLPKALRPYQEMPKAARVCPHCKQGGDDLGKYITVSIRWDADNDCWHCFLCGFVGFKNLHRKQTTWVTSN